MAPTLDSLLTPLLSRALEEQLPPLLTATLLSILPEVVRRARLPEYMTRAEAAEYSGVSIRKLDYLRTSGRLPYSKRAGRVMVKTADLDAYLEAGRVASKRER